TRPAGCHGQEGVIYFGNDLARVLDVAEVLGEGLESAGLLVLVVIAGTLAAARRGDLPANEEHRDGIGEGRGQWRGGVVEGRSAQGEADAGLAGGAGVAVGHERRCLLVSGQNMADARLPVKRIVDRRELPARVAEDVSHAVLAQPGYQQIGARNELGHAVFL